MVRRAARALTAILLALSAGPLGTHAAAGDSTLSCTGALPGSIPPAHAGALRYGISPGVQAGQTGPVAAPALPAVMPLQITNLHQVAGGHPFVVRLTRIFWPEPAGRRAELDRDIAAYSGAGFLVELQLRYHPASDPRNPANPAAFAAWAAGMAQRYDSNSSLVSIQVTNEVNFKYSGDSSDGAYAGAEDALIQGVESVKHALATDGNTHAKVGFNWFYRSQPVDEEQFWTYLRDHGGASFVGALDWVGLDAYPGTFFPPAESGNGFHDGMVNAISELRDCYMTFAGIGAATPIYIEETGFPTDAALRSPERQLEVLRQLTSAAHEYAGNYNVTDFRWFNLRDADSSSPVLYQHYGLLRSDYSQKPAFCGYVLVVSGRACGQVAAGSAALVPNLPATGAP